MRQRKEDIRALVLENIKYLEGKTLTDSSWEVILNYNWPGNVRELITVLKRAGIMFDSPISGEDIQSIIKQGIYNKSFQSENQTDKFELIWKEIKAGKSFWNGLWARFIDRDVDRHFVKKVLKRAYTESSNNFKKMNRLLNVDKKDYQTFMSLMYRYKIDPRK